MRDISKALWDMKEVSYGDFSSRLTPGVDRELIIGIRLPLLRKFARTLECHEREHFISVLPHRYLEEYHLHSFIVSDIKDFDTAITETERFLPYVDNWAVCDSFSPKVFSKNKDRLLPYVDKWISDTHPYTVRFAVKMLMVHFLDGDFSDTFPKKVSSVKSDEYYIKMMVAWYFATALAKQYDKVLPYLEDRLLDSEIHAMTLRKAFDSYRISDDRKNYLRQLK